MDLKLIYFVLGYYLCHIFIVLSQHLQLEKTFRKCCSPALLGSKLECLYTSKYMKAAVARRRIFYHPHAIRYSLHQRYKLKFK